MSLNVLTLPRSALQGSLGLHLPWLALIPLALIPLLGADSGRLNTLLFATELLLMAAGARRAVWIPAALLLSEMTAANYMHTFGGFELSNRLLLTAVSIPIVMPHIATKFDIGPNARSTVFLGAAFVALTTGVNMIWAEDGHVLQFLRYIGIGMYVMLLIPACVKTRDDLWDLVALLFGIAVLSGVVGLFQHWSGSRGTPLWEVVPHAGAPGETFSTWEERALGLSENPIHAGNVMMVAGLFALGVVIAVPMSVNAKRGMVLSLLIMCAMGYFTFTRSWGLAMIPAFLTLAMLYKGSYKKEVWILIFLLAGGLWYWSDLQGNRYTETDDDSGSAAARPVLWSVGLGIAYDHPWLGVGHDAFLELSPEYAGNADADLLDKAGGDQLLGHYTPHNDLLNIWLSWGFFTLIVYAAFSIVIGKNFFDVYSSNTDPLLRGLALGGLAALVGFQFNSLFHNFLDSTLTLWAIAGFSLVLMKIPPLAPEREKPDLPPRPQLMIRDELGDWEECAV